MEWRLRTSERRGWSNDVLEQNFFNRQTKFACFLFICSFTYKTHVRHSFPCTIRSSGATAAFLGEVGHLLIMELHHLTINHESNLGTAQQKQTEHLLFWASLQRPLRHSFAEFSQLAVFSLLCPLGAALDQCPYERSWVLLVQVQQSPTPTDVRIPPVC